MSKLSTRALLACIITTTLMGAPASAHERREVGAYTVVVGWADEPTFTGFKNGVQIVMTDAAEQPIVDLVPEELKVEVEFGGSKTGPLPVEPRFRVGAFGRPGDYQAPLIPTRPGTYTFHFTGSIKGQPVNESFTSSKDTFNSPREPSEVEFPVKDPSRAQLGARALRVDQRASGARSAATAALVAAAAAILMAGAGLVMAARKARSG